MAFAPPVALFPVRTVWTRPLEVRPAAPPAFLGSVAYVPTSDKHLIAYDLVTGQPIWTTEAEAVSQPAAGGEWVFAAASAGLAAIRAADGARTWRVPLDAPLAAPPVWDNGWLIAATADGVVRTLRAADGTVIWQRNLGAPLRVRPALAADRVFLAIADGRIVALQIKNGEPIWERRLGGPPSDLLALDDRVFAGSEDNSFYAIAARDGRIEWRFSTGGDVIGAPVVDERRVYFVALDNMLRALDRRSGSQQWLRALPLRPTRGPVLAADTVLISGSSPTVHAFFAKDGRPAGQAAVDGAVYALPHVVSDPLLVILVSDDVVKGAAATAIGAKPAEVAVPAARFFRTPDASWDAPLTKRWRG